MEFCPECGTRLNSLRKKEEKKSVLFFSCPKCNYEKKIDSVPSKLPMNNLNLRQSDSQKLIAVIGRKEQKLRTLPTIKKECPKCGKNIAYVWQVQTRGSDESSTQFFRCKNCNYTFREYS
jgi:DNA-directed RNA polymerase subunit M